MEAYQTNRAPSQHRRVSSVRRLHAALLAAMTLGALLWAVAVLVGGLNLEDKEFFILAGIYGVMSACFVIQRLQGNLVRIFDIPVFITIVAFIRFGLVPVYCYFDPPVDLYTSQGNTHTLLQALVYVTLGMIAFWLGCYWVKKFKNTNLRSREEFNFAREDGAANSVLTWALVFYAMSFVAKIYLLREHMFSYTALLDVYYDHLASAQIIDGISQFGTFAMILVGIERYSEPSNGKLRLIFNLIFTSECVWGLISGMKSMLIWNVVLLVVISSIVQKKLRIRWILAILPLFIVVYPFYNQYREMVRSNGMDITSLSSARQIIGQAFSESITNQSNAATWIGNGIDSATARLDLLDSVSTVISMGPELADLRTRGYWWMLPVYPFVPRIAWPSKPVEDVGLNFSIALGGNHETSAAITYPGDLYLELGVPGVIGGMFILGLFCQWLTNKIGDPSNQASLFIYAALFADVVGLEEDAFGLWTGIIKLLVISSAVAWLVYRTKHPRVALSHRIAAVAQ
jgi:oligosaccharide repeat unit polymerase